jgi:hypothetical protein
MRPSIGAAPTRRRERPPQQRELCLIFGLGKMSVVKLQETAQGDLGIQVSRALERLWADRLKACNLPHPVLLTGTGAYLRQSQCDISHVTPAGR